MSLIFLIGMPGAGKSSMARIWAQSYNWRALDMDAMIERKHGSITGIFELYGEDFFRKEERAVLDELIAAGHTKTIIATGGGTPCFFDNLEKMRRAGCVIYIEATLQELEARLSGAVTARPLLKGDQAARIAALLGERTEIYRGAHFTYPSASVTVATFAEIIDLCTNRRL